MLGPRCSWAPSPSLNRWCFGSSFQGSIQRGPGNCCVSSVAFSGKLRDMSCGVERESRRENRDDHD